MNKWMDGWMNGWMDGQMDKWICGWMDGWINGQINGWVDGWMDGWINGWMDRMDVQHQIEQKQLPTKVFHELGNKLSAVTDHIDVLERLVSNIYFLRKSETLPEGHIDKFTISIENDLRKLPHKREALTHSTHKTCVLSVWLLMGGGVDG